jgi:hypothetical protein
MTSIFVQHGNIGPDWQPVGWVEPTGPARSGAASSRSRGDELSAKLHQRRQLFFTANLAERRLRLLVDYIDLLRQAFRLFGGAIRSTSKPS